jgi:hypothetical protein
MRLLSVLWFFFSPCLRDSVVDSCVIVSAMVTER